MPNGPTLQVKIRFDLWRNNGYELSNDGSKSVAHLTTKKSHTMKTVKVSSNRQKSVFDTRKKPAF